MKPTTQIFGKRFIGPAAFRRLCVETSRLWHAVTIQTPAVFRRLCVETSKSLFPATMVLPAAFRRLCVETLDVPPR